MPSIRTRLATVLAAAALSSPLAAQHNLSAYFFGGATFDLFGASVSGAGDVNGDGFDDIIVGAPGGVGSARVISGANGAALYTFVGDTVGDQFGFAVSGAGDVNADGFADLIVGAAFDDNAGFNSGSARVFSGATGAILYTFNGDSMNDNFGAAVSGAGDVNNDGFADLIVGAPGDDNTASNSGSARVFSGINGAILYTFNGDGSADDFGSTVSGAGDLNNDGFDDLIVGARTDDNTGVDSGSVRAFSGINGAVLYTRNGDSAGDRFGSSVRAAGDVNNDGFDDVIVGAGFDDNAGADSGSARVLGGAAGTTLHTFNGAAAGDNFGSAVSGAGDVNNDGFDDLIVGAYHADVGGVDSGSATVFSGASGAILYLFHGDGAGDQFGNSVAAAGDANNDGRADFVIGAPFDEAVLANTGGARLVLSWLAAPAPAPCPGDINGDGQVTFADLNILLSNYNALCPTP